MEAQEEDYFSESKRSLEQYVRDRIWLLKLQAGEKIGQVVSRLIILMVLGALAFFTILFLSVMLGMYLSEITGSLFIGFGIVAGLYLLLFFVLILARKWFQKKLLDMIIRVLFANTQENEKEG